MDFRLTKEEEAFKREFLEWLEANAPEAFDLPDHQLPKDWQERAGLYRDCQRKLFDAGYAGITYPKEYGGRGGTPSEQIIVSEIIKASLNRTVDQINAVGLGMAGPTILARGTEEQKQMFIPSLLKGDHIWCQGFSEPDAGSDVASISTSAVRDGDDYVVNGQKVWTTIAHVADYCLLLVRTDPDVPKHKGLSYLIMDMKLPGVEVRPLLEITGEAEFNEVFLDDVRIPKSMMIGEENQGWKIVLTTLSFERVLGDISKASKGLADYEAIVKMSKNLMRDGIPVSKDPLVRQKLAQCYIDLMVLRYSGYRSASKVAKGQVPGPEGSIGKLLESECSQRLCELALEIQGPFQQLVESSSPWLIEHGMWQFEYLHTKAATIAAGSTEIQLNIIGEMVLGLPKG